MLYRARALLDAPPFSNLLKFLNTQVLPLSVPAPTRMSGEYKNAALAMFHFVFPEEQRVISAGFGDERLRKKR